MPADPPYGRVSTVARLVNYLDAEGGSDEEIHRVVLEYLRSLESASSSADEFVLDIGGFSNRLADERLHGPSELARREALAIVQARWGSDPTASANLHYRIGRALLHQGKASDAEEVLREGVILAREAENNDFLTRNQINLAEALAHQGQYRDVHSIAAEVLDRYENNADQNASYTQYQRSLQMDAKRLLGMAHLESGDVSGAELLLFEAAQWSERNFPPDSWRRARSRNAWGECLVALRRFDEAESILLDSQSVLETEVGSESTATLDATRRLVRLYRAWGQPAEAKKWADPLPHNN